MPNVAVVLPWEAGNGKRAAFIMRFQSDLADAATLQGIVTNAKDVWHSATTRALYAGDILLDNPIAYPYELVPAAGARGPYFRRTALDVVNTTVPTAVQGTAVGNSVPPQVAVVVTFRTANFTRRGVGRVYTPPPPEAVTFGSGEISDLPGRIAMVQSIATEVEGSSPGVDIEHVVHSTVDGQLRPVVTYDGNNRVDTQRRRLL